MDNTRSKIIDATMKLIMERGYLATTTKDISVAAGINECTIFRKFKEKKDIVMEAMSMDEWNPKLQEKDFSWAGELESDLINFSHQYMKKVTPDMVKLSIGLRTPELFPYTSDEILVVPQVFKKVLKSYFREMHEKGLLGNSEYESLAMTFLSMNFGYVFLDASFGEKLTSIEKDKYIRDSVRTFVNGISL